MAHPDSPSSTTPAMLGDDDDPGDVDRGSARSAIKIFILNTSTWHVRQWQQLLHGNRLSHSYTEALPDFVKLAEAFGAHGIQAIKPGDLDGAIMEMIKVKKPVLFDCRVAALENCFPMIPSGKAHNEMLLPAEANDEATARRLPVARRWCDGGVPQDFPSP